jgi:nucleoid-associated protein YgaU
MTELNIGAFTGSKSYTGSLGTTNIDNLYKFNISSPGSFQFSLNGLSGNADIFLLNQAGAIIKSSSNSDKTAETISAEGLSAGEYTIRVLQISGDIKYTLNLAQVNTPKKADADILTGTKVETESSSTAAILPVVQISEKRETTKDLITGTPAEGKTEIPAEKVGIADKPVVTTSETKTTEKPVTTTSEIKTTEKPVTTTSEIKTTDKPVTTTSEIKTTDKPVTTTSEIKTTDKPVTTTSETKTTDKPVTTTSEIKTTDKPVTTTSEKTTDKPVTTTSEIKTTEKPVTTTSETTTDKPVTTTSETTTDKPVTTTSETTTDKPVTTTSEIKTTDKPVTITSETTTDKPVTTTSETTTDKPVTTTSEIKTTDKPVTITSETKTTDKPVTITSETTTTDKPVTTLPVTTITETTAVTKDILTGEKIATEQPKAGTTSTADKPVVASLDDAKSVDKPNTATSNLEETKKENSTPGVATTETKKEPEPTTDKKLISPFTSGVFTTDQTGRISIDYTFDGGMFQGELAIFNLEGLENLQPGSEAFIKEVAARSLSNSVKGHVVINDATEGARFSGVLGESNANEGVYLGVKGFAVTPGGKYGVMLVPNGSVKSVFDNPTVGGAQRPLFSMAMANPVEGFHFGQIADVTGEGNTFVMEDMRLDAGSDKDYNDIIFQVRGATGRAALLDTVINPDKDWRKTDLGKAVIAYAKPYITPEPKPKVDAEVSDLLDDLEKQILKPVTSDKETPKTPAPAANTDKNNVDATKVVPTDKVDPKLTNPAVETEEKVKDTGNNSGDSTKVEVTEKVDANPTTGVTTTPTAGKDTVSDSTEKLPIEKTPVPAAATEVKDKVTETPVATTLPAKSTIETEKVVLPVESKTETEVAKPVITEVAKAETPKVAVPGNSVETLETKLAVEKTPVSTAASEEKNKVSEIPVATTLPAKSKVETETVANLTPKVEAKPEVLPATSKTETEVVKTATTEVAKAETPKVAVPGNSVDSAVKEILPTPIGRKETTEVKPSLPVKQPNLETVPVTAVNRGEESQTKEIGSKTETPAVSDVIVPKESLPTSQIVAKPTESNSTAIAAPAKEELAQNYQDVNADWIARLESIKQLLSNLGSADVVGENAIDRTLIARLATMTEKLREQTRSTAVSDNTGALISRLEDMVVKVAPKPVEPVQPVQFQFPVANQPLIAIIDTDFSANNPDIDYSRITWGTDLVDGDVDPTAPADKVNGHGDHVLGIIAAKPDNGIGIDGINPDAPILAVRAIGSGRWAEALILSVDKIVESGQPNGIVNLSFDLTQINPDGSVTTRYELTPPERKAIEYARQKGVMIVAAAGNDGGVMSALAQASQEFDNIISVGAAERVNDEIALSKAYDYAGYSSYGQGLDIVADGGTADNPVLSTVGDGLGTMAGTSVATAKVTGAASQVWAANPDLNYRQVIEILKSTATDLKLPNWDSETGAGLLNISAAVHLAKTTLPETYYPPVVLIPDTWSGEGKVIPGERAVATAFLGKYYDWVPYTIRSGDTLSGIASRTMGNGSAPYFNLIAQQNGIANPNRIIAGRTISVPREVSPPVVQQQPPVQSQPAAQPTTAAQPAQQQPRSSVSEFQGQYYEWISYTIRSGDTLSGIASRTMGNGSAPYYNLIAQQNGIANPNSIQAGRTILIPRRVSGLALQPQPQPQQQQQPQPTNNTLYLSTSGGQVLAVNTATGQQSLIYQGITFTDLAVSPDGRLFGSTFNELYEINPASGQARTIGNFGGTQINSLTFSPDGRLYGADSNNGNLYQISPQTAQVSLIGSLGGPSSGDMVFNGNEIFASVSSLSGGNDALVAVNPANGSRRTIGDLGYRQVYGLAQVNGQLTAYTSTGQRLSVNPQTAAVSVTGSVSGNGEIWGAAINPSNSTSTPTPTPTPTRRPYTIRSGDTLSAIAQREMGNGNRWVEIQKADGSTFSSDEARRLQIGQVVYLPVGSSSSPAVPPPAQPGQQRQYIIKPNDTLWTVAFRELGNGDRWREIKKADGSTFTEAEARNLRVGMSVYLPVSYQTGSGKPVTLAPATGSKSESIIDALRTAIIGQESGYNYKAVNPHSGALGFAQIMPGNLPSWSREALGYQIDRNQFLNSSDLQLRIINYKLNQYYQQAIAASGGNIDIAVRRVASAWYSGDPNLYVNTRPQYYNGYPYPSIANYTLSVLGKFQQAYGGRSVGPTGAVGIGVTPIKEGPIGVGEIGVTPIDQFPWAVETPVDIGYYKIWKTYRIRVPGGTVFFELTSLTQKIQATVESEKSEEDPQTKLTLDNLKQAYKQKFIGKGDLASAFEIAGKQIEVADGVTSLGVTLLDGGKDKKIALKLEPPNEFTIEIEYPLLENGDDIKVKGSFKSELKGIYEFQPDQKAKQPQTTEDLPFWLKAAGVIIYAGRLIVPKIVAAPVLVLIQAYSLLMVIPINMVDPQPNIDPKNIA